MIIAIVAGVAVLAAAGIYVKNHGVAASLVAAKAEIAKIEAEVAAEEPVVKAKVLAVIARLKALL
jgi:hypothetical protein